MQSATQIQSRIPWRVTGVTLLFDAPRNAARVRILPAQMTCELWASIRELVALRAPGTAWCGWQCCQRNVGSTAAHRSAVMDAHQRSDTLRACMDGNTSVLDILVMVLWRLQTHMPRGVAIPICSPMAALPACQMVLSVKMLAPGWWLASPPV